jgi:hypothetical protein
MPYIAATDSIENTLKFFLCSPCFTSTVILRFFALFSLEHLPLFVLLYFVTFVLILFL